MESGFDLRTIRAFLPSTSTLALYCAPDVVAPDEGLLTIQPANALQDRDYGLWAGQPLQGFMPEEQLAFLSDATFAPPEGESFVACYQRAARWLDGMAHNRPAAVVLARPAIVRNLILRVLYADDGVVGMAQAARVDVRPTSHSLLSWHAGRWRVAMMAAPA